MAGLLLPASGGKLFVPRPRGGLFDWSQSFQPFPHNGILDTFDRADENPLANGNWTSIIASGQGGLKLLSNQAASIAAGDSASYWSATQFAADQEVFADMPVLTGAGKSLNVWVRVQNPGNPTTGAGYLLAVTPSTGLLKVFKLTGGVTFAQVSQTVSQSVTAGDGFGLSIIGSQLYVWYRVGPVGPGGWKLLQSFTEPVITGPGYIGLEIDDTTGRADNFGGGQIPALVSSGITQALVAALETDSAVALTARKSLTLGIASETDAAQALAHSKSKAIAAAIETDTAVNIKTVLFGRALETDTAMPIGHSKVKAIAPALETDSARLIVPGVARARETDIAPALGRLKTRTLGQALETDTAPTLGRSKVKAIGAASELEVALPITASGGAVQISTSFKTRTGQGL